MAAKRRRRQAVKLSKFEFSKKLAVIITVIFILTWAVAWVAWFIKGYLPDQLLSFISVPFSVVITGYFAKAGVENYQKISGSADSCEERKEADG